MPLPSRNDAPAVRIAIADDHPMFRDGLKRLLESEPGFTVVGEGHDGIEAVRLVRDLDPDVLLLDMAMPRMGGLEALSALKGQRTRVIVLTAAISEGALLTAIQLGARGVILKESATRQLLDGIHAVVDGRCVVGDGAVASLADAIRRPAGERLERRFNLTPREFEIVAAIAAGRSNKEIADGLAISVQTVKHHLTSIFSKAGVSSRLELALFAVNEGLVDSR